MTKLTLNKPTDYAKKDLKKRLTLMNVKPEIKKAVLNGDIAVFMTKTPSVCYKVNTEDNIETRSGLFSQTCESILKLAKECGTDLLKEIEYVRKQNVHVYGIILGEDLVFGYTFDLLVVNNEFNEDDPDMEEELEWYEGSGELVSYVINTNIPEYSEFGCIYTKQKNNSIYRIA